MPTLHDQLRDAASDVTVDLDHLTVSARRRGAAQRRVRRSLAVVGTATAALAIGATGWALVPGGPGGAESSVVASDTSTSTPAEPDAESGAHLDGRTAAAFAMDLLGTHGPLAVDNRSIRGQGGVALVDESGRTVLTAAENNLVYAEFRALDNAGESTIGINVQPAELGRSSSCEGLSQCTVKTVNDGDLLRTYVDDTDKPGTTRLVAEVVSATRGVRVVVASSAPTGSTQPVDLDQLAAVAADPGWGPTLPAEYEARGDALTSYTWMSELADAHPVESIETPAPDVG